MFAFIIALLIAIFPACPEEDSTGCYWDGATRGNGAGISYIALTEDIQITLKARN